MSRRGRQEGTVYQRSDGRWCAQASLGYDAKGKRIRKTVYGDSKREALRKLRELQAKADRGDIATGGASGTVGRLMDEWLEQSSDEYARNTVATYDSMIRNHVNGYRLADIPVAKVETKHIQRHLVALRRAGAGDRTRQVVLQVLRVALNYAVRLDLISSNPAKDVKRPKDTGGRSKRIMTDEEIDRLLEAAEATRHYALVVAALFTGMRQGELFALQWPQVDLDGQVIRVTHSLSNVNGNLKRKPTKTGRGRVIAIGENVCGVLREQKRLIGREGLDTDYVFCDTQGGPLRRSSFRRRRFVPIVESAGVDGLTFQDLRHNHVVMLSKNKVPIKVISERLGHASPTTTLEIYSHVLPSMQREAAEAVDGIL